MTALRFWFALSLVIVLGLQALGQQQPAAGATQAPVAESTQTSATASAEAQTLHILAGRSVIVNTQARLKRILVSNPAVVETTTVSPTQLVITAKVPGTASLVLWDETGRARILDINANVDVAALREALQEAYPNEDIRVEADQGRVILSGKASTTAVSEGAVKLASTYSQSVVNSLIIPPPPHAKEIMLKVRFAEVDRSKAQQLGLNIFSLGAANTIGSVTTQQFGPPAITMTGGTNQNQIQTTFSDLLNLFVYRPDINLGATIKALEAKNILQILAEPNLLARSGEKASFIAGGEFPYPVVQGTGTQGGALAVTIQFRPYGVKLDFTGTVNPDNTVRLKVAPEVSTLDYANSLTFQGFVVPAISTRRAETDVELKDGQSFGIAGLLDNRTTVQMSKIPGIGDIPILGTLFKSRNISKSNTELVVIVTPVIVDPIHGPVEVPATPKGPFSNLDVPKYDDAVTGHKPGNNGQQNKQ
ncbi:MAG: type II and III secretion system protein family protein [Terriglobia bacterium]|nr:type II and III secretion system protein family protein [Terriglobia bacterium]